MENYSIYTTKFQIQLADIICDVKLFETTSDNWKNLWQLSEQTFKRDDWKEYYFLEVGAVAFSGTVHFGSNQGTISYFIDRKSIGIQLSTQDQTIGEPRIELAQISNHLFSLAGLSMEEAIIPIINYQLRREQRNFDEKNSY